MSVTVVCTAVAVLARGAAELRHGQHRDVSHTFSHVLVEGSQRIAEVFQARCQLARHSTFVHMVIPSADFRESNFQPGA